MYSSDGMHWLRSSLKNFLQAADIKEVDDRDVKELFENVSDCVCVCVSVCVCALACVCACMCDEVV